MLYHLGHLAFAFTAAAYLFRDFLWLRALAILGSGSQVVWVLAVSERPFVTAFWHSVFVGINAVMLLRILFGERAVRLSEEERELHETLFAGLTRLEYMKLLRAGRWQTLEPGSVLTQQGRELGSVMLISSGSARVEAGGRTIAHIRDGQFVGEMSFTSGGPATATVTVDRPTRLLAWQRSDLCGLLRRNPSLRITLGSVLGMDMSRKLRDIASAQTPGSPGERDGR